MSTLPRKYHGIALLCFFAGLLIIHFSIYERFLPLENGLMGHDFNNYFPYFLDGYFWFTNNGLFSIPWFTPSFCGGIPRFPNPVSIYFSVPQFLVFLTDPISSARITFILFSALGLTGFYLLCRRVFNLGLAASIIGASLFLFNDFFAHKFIIGHMTYHIFMLMPLVAYLVLKPVTSEKLLSRPMFLDIALAALLMAYMFYVDIAYVSAPTFVFILTCFCLVIIRENSLAFIKSALIKLVSAGIIASAIFAAKLNAALSFLKFHDRDYYPLPGVDNIPELLTLVFNTLFVSPQHEYAASVLVNNRWALGQHELEFGITLIPLFLIVAALIFLIINFRATTSRLAFTPLRITFLVIVTLLIIAPVAFNYYSPEWNALLKQVPLFKSSSSLVRWFCLLIPVVILLSGLAFNSIRLSNRKQWVIVVLVVVGLVMIKGTKDRSYYSKEKYNPTEIMQAYNKVKQGLWSPQITDIGVYLDANKKPVISVSRNNALAHGQSQFFCYEAIFGYGLESLPFKTLQLGPVFSEQHGVLNIKNPACYVFPAENNCSSGDHFTPAEKDAAQAFTRYQPFEFNMSKRQHYANWLSLFSLGLVLLVLVFNGLYCFRQYLRNR